MKQMPVSQVSRRAAITRLLTDQVISSQDELRAQLSEMGFHVTQATVSRDLEALGAIRRSTAGQLRYEIVASSVSRLQVSHMPDNFWRMCADVLIGADSAMNTAVLRTPPGAAQFFAGALDQAELVDVVGCVAGDDTVIVVMRTTEAATALCEEALRASGGSVDSFSSENESRRTS